jgi:hypothetical protein
MNDSGKDFHYMRVRLLKIVGYLLPIITVMILSPLLLTILKLFGTSGTAKNILDTLLYVDFYVFWYGSIPYLLFLGSVFVIRSQLKPTGYSYSHLYSPLLLSTIFFLFWGGVSLITGNPPVDFILYIKTWLLPTSLYLAIGGYLYLSLAGLLYIRMIKEVNVGKKY